MVILQPYHITAAGTYVLLPVLGGGGSGAGWLESVTVNSLGALGSTITLKSGASTIAIINAATALGTFLYGYYVAGGLTVIVAGTPGDYTVIYG